MFSSFTSRILLGLYIFILLSIPIGAYLVSQTQNYKTMAQQEKVVKPKTQITPKPTTPPVKELVDTSLVNSISELLSPSPSPTPVSPEIASSFGPTLSLKVTLEGRPEGNFATKLFIGIVEGIMTTNPKFLLSFSVNLPASGSYSNLSLAGLNPGSRYSALLKGSAQIATSSAFILSPTITNLNDGQPLNLLSGDLNEDNIINSADYSIAQKALGATAMSSNWNENADLNKDGIVNTFDLGIIAKNLGSIGASGAWISPIPKLASSSATFSEPSVGGPIEQTGHWIWVPNL